MASQKFDDRTSMPTLIAEYRSRVLQIGVYFLPILISAFYPCSHSNFLLVDQLISARDYVVPQSPKGEKRPRFVLVQPLGRNRTVSTR